MNTLQNLKRLLASTLATVFTLFLAINTSFAQQPAPAPGAEPAAGAAPTSSDYDVLAQGPVHEAFADVVSYDPTPGMTVNRKPPEVIEELPPAEKPQGENVVWIPGYWGWDEERDDFVWVSGIWRAVPPGQNWTPGFWEATDGGYQWISGFWFTGESEITYLPEPPQSLEEGPSSPQPSENHFWIPGCWRYRDANYVWRPGYWYDVQPNWVWVPSCYRWTPYGYVYRSGYWDYPLERRGLLFAPVYFHNHSYARSGFYYRPNYLVDTGLLLANLFIHSGHRHYYYGDYGHHSYHDRGYRPWFEAGHRRDVYSPLYSHYQWQHRHDKDDWRSNLSRQYRERSERSERSDQVGPRTLADLQKQGQSDRFDRSDKDRGESHRIVRQFDDVRREKSGQFEKISQQQRSRIEQNVDKYRKLQRDFADSSRVGKASDSRSDKDKPGLKFGGTDDGRFRREAAKPVIQFGPPQGTGSARQSTDSRQKFDSVKRFEPTRSFDTSRSKAAPQSKDAFKSKDSSKSRDFSRPGDSSKSRDFSRPGDSSRSRDFSRPSDSSKSKDFSRREDTPRSTTRSKGEFPAQAPGSSLNRRPPVDQLIRERSSALLTQKSKSSSSSDRGKSYSKSRDSSPSQFKSRESSGSKYRGSSRSDSRSFESSRGKSSGSSDRGRSNSGRSDRGGKSSGKSDKGGKGKK